LGVEIDFQAPGGASGRQGADGFGLLSGDLAGGGHDANADGRTAGHDEVPLMGRRRTRRRCALVRLREPL